MIRRLSMLLGLLAFLLTLTAILRHPGASLRPPDRERREERSGAMEALEFWTRARAYPERDVPASAYYRAFQSAITKRRQAEKTASSSNIWEPIGPTNLHGRAISVAINPQNPNTIYLGTASGGLWRSYTSGLGTDWQLVPLGYPALGISSIVIDPTDSNTIYLGTGEVYRYLGALGGLVWRTTRGSYGIGILKTTNGGASWTKSLDWTYNQQTGIQKIAMNPLNPKTLYTATTDGFYKTVDAGANWTNILFTTMGEDIVIDGADTNRLMISAGNFEQNPLIYTSTNGGGVWVDVTPTTFSGKALLSGHVADPSIVFASIGDSTTGVGGLWRTTNFGGSWTQVSNSTTNGIWGVQGWYSHYVVVHPTNPNLVIHNAVGMSKSTNGGVSFVPVSGGYSDNHGYAVHPTDPNIVYTANDDGIYRSTDFGTSWTDVGAGLQTGQFYNGFSNSSTDSLMAIVQSQDHIPGYRYLGSMVWDHSTVRDEAGWTATDPTNDNIQYAVDRNGTAIYKSTNRGASFPFLRSFGGIGSWNSPFAIAPSNTNVLYFGDTRVWSTLNGGATWSVTGTLDGGNPALSIAIASSSPDTAIIGMAPFVIGAHVFRTTNGGALWTNITGSLPDRYPIDLAIDPNDARTMYAAMGGFGTGHLFKSTNTGAGWTNISGTLPDAPATAIAIDPLNSNFVYVGNDIGVYLSTNGGSTWTPFSSGLPDAVIVADLVVSPSNRSLRCITHGNGAYERRLFNGTAPPAFDYRALSFNVPGDGATIARAVPLSGIKASFKNSGTAAQTDSFFVKYRILRIGLEVFSSTKKIAGLGINVTKIVTFDDTFTPADTGTYALQAITLASDQDASNDTARGSATVIEPSNVSLWKVTKEYCPYTEIVGGLPGPAGDDIQSRVPLPFPFIYDGYPYDSLQISTNGWAELGGGTGGSLHGLSTSGQVGGFFNQVLGTTGRPTKALGPWWGDLGTGSIGAITSTTIGSAPNREFVVQWKNVLAYFDEFSSTLKLNFQLRLHEGSNVVEFRYGPVIAGTLVTSGAACGLKDYIGGDFRYFDLARNASGFSSELRTDLTPLSNWPGQDSCFHIVTNPTGISVSLNAVWNLVSLPVVRADRSIHAIFPSSSGHGFQYAGIYQPVDSLLPGRGFWVKLPGATTQFIAGDSLPSVTATATTGWNIIGSVDHPVSAPTVGGIITSPVYGYTGSGYAIVSTLVPGKGYWVKTNSGGSIPLGPEAAPRIAADPISSSSRITISDRLGRKQSLYLAPQESAEAGLYVMPPVPPAEAFDARFASQQMVETYPRELKEPARFPVLLQSALYPLTITYEIKNAAGTLITLIEGDGKRSHPLSGEGVVRIAAGEISLAVSAGRTVPAAFALRQNYPNPFNPATTIAFDLPVGVRVTLKVYDILGREVSTLADGMYEAGSYAIPADFSNSATGVYLYRLTAGGFTEVKKLLVTK